MENQSEKSKKININLADNETLKKLLDPKSPLAKDIVTGMMQQDNEDAAVDRIIKERDAKMKLWKGLIETSVMYIVGGILILFIGIASYSILTNAKADNDEKSWARTTLTSLATGVIGFLFGKQGSKDS